MMRYLSLSLLLLSVPVTRVLSVYDELRIFGGACPPHDTCRTLESSDDDHLWGKRSCECGSHCIRRNTCCIDSPHAGRYYILPPQDESCQMVPTTTFEVQMVSTCPTRWRDRSVIHKCTESEDSDMSDPLMEAPVTSRTSERTYKNYFCALCNQDAEDVILWNIDIRGVPAENATSEDIITSLVFDAAEGSWGVVTEDRVTFKKVKLRFVLPKSLKKIVKKCYSKMVNRCSDSLGGATVLRLKCLAYYAPVRLKQGQLRVKYRNVHCGLCNNATAVGVEDDVCLLESPLRKTRPKVNFALLLDVNGDGHTVGGIDPCKNGQVMDPFFKKCRSMKCGKPNHVVKNKTCVKVE